MNMKLHFTPLISAFQNYFVSFFYSSFFITSFLSLLLYFPLLLDFPPRTILSPNALPRPNYFYFTDEQTHVIVNFILSLGVCNIFQALVPYRDILLIPALHNTSSYTLRVSAVTIQLNSTAVVTGTSSSL